MSITQKIDLFFSKHRNLSQAIFPSLFSLLLTFPLLLVEQYVIFLILFCLIGLFSLIFISVAPMRLSFHGIKALQTGDPYPLLDISETLLSFKLSESQRQSAIINHCEGLRYTGKYEEAYSEMSNLNIDKIANTTQSKIIYYSNLSDLCALLGKYDESAFHYKKVLALYADMKDGFEKRNIQKTNLMLFLNVQNSFISKRYEDVIRLSSMYFSNKEAKENVASVTDFSLICALAHYQKGEFDLAKSLINIIIQNGNKLHAVTEAKNLLSQIEAQ